MESDSQQIIDVVMAINQSARNVFFRTSAVHINDATLAFKHYAPAYTDSDISVHFTNADIFQADFRIRLKP